MRNFTKPRFLHEYFLQFSSKIPDQLAIISNHAEWTYSQLKKQSEAYAKDLEEIGLSIGDRVILEFEPCPEAVALIIACSIRGLVFIPANPDTPQERIESIISNTEARLHIQKERIRTFSQHPHLICGYLDKDAIITDSITKPEVNRKEMRLLESNLIYIIFTSGTTGQPKGIMMSHRAVLSFFDGLIHFCDIPEKTRVGSISPLQFDFSILDMGLALGSGGTLVHVPRSLVYHPKRFLEYIDRHQVNQMNAVPSMWKSILEYAGNNVISNMHLSSIMYGGEYFPIDDLRSLQSLFCLTRIINAFGPSESIGCSFKNIEIPIPEGLSNLSIGVGMHNAEMLLVDEEGALIREPDVVGEIYLRSPCLFSGYWRDEALTQMRLIPLPLLPDSGERVFKTGDLAYQDESGDFYYVGRTDNQVKVLGNRIELEEVERKLMSHPAINQVSVIVEEGQLPLLHAFVVLNDPKLKTPPRDLRRYCAKTLPTYMLPGKFDFLDSLPLNANGKVDRNALKRLYQKV
ncbi:amino acid adenylation domain-containing protein [Paenibacillus ihbetae]|uniref:AMP-binding protein n=1 Tax=Paenibacillus ihbetae TaxID=1870820 RepID=A0ABX3JS82_9BACL|nr:amino acid adenylation domain-containing protein [Paenibacillus ihbetae]OOC58790.1 AMP-binding protein [Paenibacillus ihbetae]